MRYAVCPLAGLKETVVAARDLLTRANVLPGMALIVGPSGRGKTFAAAHAATVTNAIFERALDYWTMHSMLVALAAHFGLRPAHRSQPLFEGIVRSLQAEPRLLIVDECDSLRDPRCLELLRAIHDRSAAPVMLIGVESFARRLRHREQIWGRLLHVVEFKPPSIGDTRALADSLCELKVADETVARLHGAAHGSIRRIVVMLAALERNARRRGHDRVIATDWPGHESAAVQSRRVAA
ncbi:MAG: AAA family ATPase [Candidatus Binataceae bacterium]